jgi:hypothetical protein
MSQERIEQPYLFLLAQPTLETRKKAVSYLQEMGVKVVSQFGESAIVGNATEQRAEEVRKSKMFLGVFSKAITKIKEERLSEEQKRAIEQWNFSLSPEYREVKKDLKHIGKKWVTKGLEPPKPYSIVDPQRFEEELLKRLKLNEKAFKKKYAEKAKEMPKLEGEKFAEYERTLAKTLKNETLAYYTARIAVNLAPEYQYYLKTIDPEILKWLSDFLWAWLHPEEGCWKLENEISVGIVFVESSISGGPVFTSSNRLTLQQEITDGLTWLANYEPKANVSWVFDWQYTKINVANGTGSPAEDYWRNPAMQQVNYHGSTYTGDWSGIDKYRTDMRLRNRSAHAVVIFVTPYANSWHAYAGSHRITLANKGNWGGWGIATIDSIVAHEMCHIFGATDEYTGSGTPCSSCGGQFGCNKIPNGNCGSCASPHQACIMDQNTHRICAYTQGHIGWADLFVELTTADELWAGTDDDVWLDIGDRTFYLDTPDHNDREQGNVEGYALNYTGVTKEQIKRVGIRKSPDGFAGGWKLKRVRLWCRGELICDATANQWLEDNYRWWASGTCGTGGGIVNILRVEITTADVMWAGTDDDVTIYLGGRSWNLDNVAHNDFERGHTDAFNLDPGVSLYLSGITTVHIHKSPDGAAGGWKLKGVKVTANGSVIYNNQSINKWLEDNNRDWQAPI